MINDDLNTIYPLGDSGFTSQLTEVTNYTITADLSFIVTQELINYEILCSDFGNTSKIAVITNITPTSMLLYKLYYTIKNSIHEHTKCF